MSFSPISLAAWWAEDEGFEFELWKDDDKTLALALGAVSSDSAIYCDRVSFLLDPDGQVVLEYIDSVDTGTHPGQVLADIKLLFGVE